ncbi:Uncharacterised protein [Klebsiella pneumoniae]|nr:Uncharacterised protein [Klebsiella pneumoniae]
MISVITNSSKMQNIIWIRHISINPIRNIFTKSTSNFRFVSLHICFT